MCVCVCVCVCVYYKHNDILTDKDHEYCVAPLSKVR